MVKRTSKKPPQLGFSIGIAFVIAAFLLMGVRVFTQPPRGSQQANPASASTQNQNAQQLLAQLPQATTPIPIWQTPKIPTKVQVPVHAFNPRLGRANAPIQVYVFGHINCEQCYKALKAAKNFAVQNPTQVRLIIKFAAHQPLNNSVEAGLFTLLAQDENAFWEVQEKLAFSTQNSLPTAYLNAFEAAGFSLRNIRTKLANRTEIYMRQLETDLEDFAALGISELPVVLINNTLLPAASADGITQELAQALQATTF